MTRTPRQHQPDVRKIPTPATSAGDQDLDPREDTSALDEPERMVKVADDASSTAGGGDIRRERGELYGQGIAPTGDIDEDGVRSIQDYTDDGGESFTEALLISAAENGPAGEAPIDDVRGTDADDEEHDDDDDIPLADLGAAGPAGV